MVSLKTLASAAAALAATASALPASIAARQAQMAAPAKGDIVTVTLADQLELAENAFYDQAITDMSKKLNRRAPGSTGNNMDAKIMDTLTRIKKSEEQHIVTLGSKIATMGAKPPQACKYKFDTSSVKSIMATANQLEAIGIAAYGGAAPGISDKNVLAAAAAILPVEARHQTMLQELQAAMDATAAQGGAPAAQKPLEAFDKPISPKASASALKSIIESCPDGSEASIEAFPALSMMPGQDATAMKAGATVKLQVEQTANAAQGTNNAAQGAGAAQMCAFVTTPDKAPTGTIFMPFSEAQGCEVPSALSGETFVFLTSTNPADGTLSDDITVAGPMLMSLP